jgi:predicted hydrocarbon binding protein/KaiC/GvpD/RAD55 family RecA-like ATPase
MVSSTQLQEIPPGNMVLLVGTPGSGKSTFCHQTVLSNIEFKPVIYVTTESGSIKVLNSLRDKGLGEILPHPLGFVDAFHETVGLPTISRSDTVFSSSEDLTSLGIAISKQRERMGETSLLVFDSLTSPYLFNGQELLRFIRQTLSRFAAEGNAILVCVDEGCGKPEDLVVMASIPDGVIKIEMEESQRFLNIIKHPKLRTTRIAVSMTPPLGLDARLFDPVLLKQFVLAEIRGEETGFRSETGDYVNLFWPNLARWSSIVWDPQRFPMLTYELNKNDYPSMFKISRSDKEIFNAIFPWRLRLLLKLMPKSLSKVKDMKKPITSRSRTLMTENVGIMEYLEDVSKTEEHYIRVYENFDCTGFDAIGAPMALHLPPFIAGMCIALESMKGLERDWNAVETKCIGLGDPYCEFKLVPGIIDELDKSLEKDSLVIERIHKKLMNCLMGFLLDGKPLVKRPRLGSDIGLHPVWHTMALPAQAGERYRMALRLGGAVTGKDIGKSIIDAGIEENDAVKRILHFLDYCKVGKVAMDETIRIKESCESLWSKFWSTPEVSEPSCFFTTGFLNGFFSAVKNQHIKETRCIGLGDPYCEWEFR